MGIDGLSTLYSQIQRSSLADSVGLVMLSKAKDQFVQQGIDTIRMMEQSVQPNLGSRLDVRV
jgi:hypothetical protein